MSLTAKELEAIDLTVRLVNALHDIVGDGPTRQQDLTEFVYHVHAIQRTIMAQSAARAHPDKLRLLGEEVLRLLEEVL